MSILSKIREQLKRNPDVVVLRYPEPFNSPFARSGPSNQFRTSIVAPREGLYEVDELQRFMEGLVRGPKPSEVFPFKEDGKYLQTGILIFREDLVTERVKTTTTVEVDDWEDRGFAKGSRTVKEKSRGHATGVTTVLVYPNREIGERCRKTRGEENITLDELRRYRHSRLI